MLAISGYGLSLRSFFMSLLIYLIHMEPKRSDPSQINGFYSVSSIHLTLSYSSFGVSAFCFGYYAYIHTFHFSLFLVFLLFIILFGLGCKPSLNNKRLNK